jgi:hypothetical protein
MEIRHLCGIVTQDRLEATLYFRRAFKASMVSFAIRRCGGATH